MIPILLDRALALAEARKFFFERNIVEVDCPLMAKSACIDLHIDLFKVESKNFKTHYLPSSPEYFMKRLLCNGMGDIYQLAHVFRDEEVSPLHNPEFMMAEWYRLNFSLDQMIEETLSFITLFIGKHDIKQISYREAIITYCHIDYVHASDQELFECLVNHGITPYKGILEEGRDALLNLILGTLVEPQFKNLELVVLKYYPASQAALAKKIEIDDESCGMRFEVFFKGIELANGYFELCDAVDQEKRLIEANALRKAHGKEELPIDYDFLKALQKGMPPACGVAVGFDRLMMIRNNIHTINEVLPFGYTHFSGCLDIL